MLSIGALARKTGAKVQTIRYYEQIGMLPEAERSAGGQRRYRAADLDRLSFIRHARQLGFALGDIREMLELTDRPDQSCGAVDEIASRQLDLVRQRIARLRALERELQRMVESCKGDSVARCRILEVLRDHSQCLTDHDAAG